MAAKVFLAIGVGVGIALLLQAHCESQNEADTLKAEANQWAERVAQLFVGAVERAMLRGDGIDVRESIADLEQRVPGIHVQIFDHRGIEVFGVKPPPPAPHEIPAEVAAVMDEPERRLAEGGHVVRAVPNEERCHRCHEAGDRLRGVLAIDFATERCVATRERLLAQIIAEGFTQVMSGRQAKLLDDYFRELSRATGGTGAVAVYDADAELVFGEPIPGIEPALLEPLLAPGAAASYQTMERGRLALVPLPMQDRCVACHDDPIGAPRGVLAVALTDGGAGETSVLMELEGTIDTSLRFIMLSRMGRRIADFLDAVARNGAVERLVLYDHRGRRFWTTEHPAPPPHVADVLASGEPLYFFSGQGMGERLHTIAPLPNREGCIQCHGSGSALRGAVEVSVSTAVAERASRASMQRRTWFTAFNLLGILVILATVLQYLVARPVRAIGDIADEVSRGNLSVSVARADPEGDEIARLGDRINEMVRGLRTKMHLEKFVSRGAVEAATGAGARAISRAGERRSATVLFSDIRGFTAYSERARPEDVVEMLNRLLRAQAESVVAFGGDIDKFVGDELMAIFTGDDAEQQAVSCALHMLDAVAAARRAGETLSVGIGISSGEVVYGAVGHEARMDFTVIGDVVNTGARLCSAAGEDEILVSPSVRERVGEHPDIHFSPGEPLALKGKSEPVPVFRARRKG